MAEKEFDSPSFSTAAAPCGPGCRSAQELPGWPDFVWCTTRGEPHRTGDDSYCQFFVSRPSGVEAYVPAKDKTPPTDGTQPAG